MEIIRMDKTSHFTSGPSAERIHELNYDFSEIDRNVCSSGSLSEKVQSRTYVNASNGYQEVQSNENLSNWKYDHIECKQEANVPTFINDMISSDNGNLGLENEFNESYQYECNLSEPLYTNDASNSNTLDTQALYKPRVGPYHITSSKNQLPTWYAPPENFCLPPSDLSQYPFQQGSFQGSQSSSVIDQNMRNMIHLTNRNGREARNRAEKHRRDKLNGSIQELSSMVPHVAESPRRVDKTAVLRFSAHGLRIDYVFGNQKPNRYIINPKSTEGLMKLLDTFLLSVTCRGNIVLVSNSVEQYLGHCRSDLFGQSLLNITHPEDHAFLKQQLIPTDLHNLFAAKTDENDEIRSRTQEEEEEIDKKLREDRRDFTLRLARAGPRSEPTVYEMVRIDGCFRRADQAPRGRPSAGPTGLQLIRRARGRDDNIPLHSISGNDIILIAMARIIKPPMFCDRLIEACRYEYKTRHLIDGRIVQCDQRISIVAGYLIEEISGLSPFTFIHRDDVRWVMVALRQMYDFGKPYGESCYRLMSRTGQFIYLKTRGCLEVDAKTRQVHSFVCVNSLVSDEEGKRLVREMKKKFSAIISEEELSAMESDVPAVENPQKLERAILNLITNLNNATSCDDDNVSMISESTVENEDNTRRTPLPLAIIPPKSNTIKSSIFKAVNVIGQALKGQSPTIKDEPRSPETPSQTNYAFHHDSSHQINIKSEPACILSPTSSSMSSLDSDLSSPFLSSSGNIQHQSVVTTNDRINSNSLKASANDIKKLDYFLPYDNFSNSSIDATPAINTLTSTATETNMNNNNNGNINRNSVLKRVYASSDNDDDYNELTKKPTLSLHSVLGSSASETSVKSCLDMLNMPVCATDISDVLSPTFPDDSLTEPFNCGISQILQNSIETLTPEQEEQREILNSLRESCSVITASSKNSPNSNCKKDDR